MIIRHSALKESQTYIVVSFVVKKKKKKKLIFTLLNHLNS